MITNVTTRISTFAITTKITNMPISPSKMTFPISFPIGIVLTRVGENCKLTFDTNKNKRLKFNRLLFSGAGGIRTRKYLGRKLVDSQLRLPITPQPRSIEEHETDVLAHIGFLLSMAISYIKIRGNSKAFGLKLKQVDT